MSLIVLVASSAFAQDGGTIEILVGAQQVIEIPGLQRIAIGDSAIADVKTIGNSQVLVIGAAAGRTTLLATTSGGRISYLVNVARGLHEIATLEEGVNLEKGELMTFKATGFSTVQVVDASIVDAKLANGRLVLQGKARGRSDLVLSRAKLGPLQVAVRVTQPAAMTLEGLELKLGQTVTVIIDNLTAVASSGTSVGAAVKEPGRLILTGRGAGQANLELTVGGATQSLNVRILP